MSDFERELRKLDDLGVNDVWERARDRSQGPLPPDEPRGPRPGSGWNRALTIVVAFAVFAAGAALVIRSFAGPPNSTPSDETASPEVLDGDIPAKLSITCRDDGAVVSPAVVELGPTGVDVTIDNRSAHDLVYMRDPERIGRSIGLEIGSSPDEGREDLEIVPGRWVVDCFTVKEDGFSTYDVPVETYTGTFEVIDPSGNLARLRDARICGEPLIDLAATAGSDGELATTPTGSLFVEAELPDGSTQVIIVPLDGSEPRVIPLPPDVWRVELSPDSSRLVYELADDADGDPTHTDASLEDGELYTSDLDGNDVRRLTDNRAADYVAEWTADGSRISFLSNRDRDIEIWMMNADGSDARKVLPDGWHGSSHEWSPDGSRLAFLGDPGLDEADGCRFDLDLYVADADGSNIVRLTDDEWYSSSPSWSPDGTRIVFSASNQSDEDHDVMMINADGSGLTRLTDATGWDGGAVWSPDGQLIAFESERGLPGEGRRSEVGRIFVMNADGSGQRLLFGPGSPGYVDGSAVGAFAWMP